MQINDIHHTYERREEADSSRDQSRPEHHEKVERGTEYTHRSMNARGFFGAVLVLIAAVGLMAALNPFAGSNFPPVSPEKWQAVFLNNNQVYFGHLKNINQSYAAIDNIFYLRFNQPLQQGEEVPLSALSLIKLGGELHGPDDRMYIPKTNILFWENLNDASPVVQSINNFYAEPSQPSGQ